MKLPPHWICNVAVFCEVWLGAKSRNDNKTREMNDKFARLINYCWEMIDISQEMTDKFSTGDKKPNLYFFSEINSIISLFTVK